MTRVNFGRFADGTVGGEISDTSQNWFAPHVTYHASGGPNGRPYVSLVADDSMQFPNQDGSGQKHARIHGVGVAGGTPSFYNRGHEMWRPVSMRVPSSATNTNSSTTDEIHGDNGTGPAPQNLSFTRGGYWIDINRGGNRTDGNYDMQTGIGPMPVTDAGVQQQFDWVGGNKPVVLDEWLHLLIGRYLETTVAGGAWYEAWAAWGSMGRLKQISPRRSFQTCYPDKDGDGKAVIPFMSLYYDVGQGVSNAVDISVGALFDNRAEAFAWFNRELGFSPKPVRSGGRRRLARH